MFYNIATSLCAKKYIKQGKRKRVVKEETLKDTAEFDFSNITHDWERCKLLYDILKKKCHPDKFEIDKQEEATQIFQQIQKNKYSYQELLKVKNDAIKLLGIEL